MGISSTLFGKTFLSLVAFFKYDKKSFFSQHLIIDDHLKRNKVNSHRMYSETILSFNVASLFLLVHEARTKGPDKNLE